MDVDAKENYNVGVWAPLIADPVALGPILTHTPVLVAGVTLTPRADSPTRMAMLSALSHVHGPHQSYSPRCQLPRIQDSVLRYGLPRNVAEIVG